MQHDPLQENNWANAKEIAVYINVMEVSQAKTCSNKYSKMLK